MVMTGGDVAGGRTGGVGSDVNLDSELGWARGTKAGARETVVEMLRMSRGTAEDPPPRPPMVLEEATKAPPHKCQKWI